MARSRYGARVSRGTAPSRKFVWVRKTLSSTGANVATGTDLLSDFETAYGAQLIGCTIVRVRGVMFAFTDTLAGTANHFRFSARVTSGNVDISGPVPTLTAFGDPNADWMLYEPFMPVVDESQGSHGSIHRTIDVKSNRKIEELGERFIMFQAANPAAPAVNWGYGYDLSIGIKLP